MKSMNPGHRRAFVLAEFENLPYEQIAQIEGVRIGTIKSRINRAKHRLRSALDGIDGDVQ
jgi:DNA-directed RNA polymerase specialized sigma24 family protein